MNKHDLSVSMARANLIVFFIAIPVVVLQFVLFGIFHPAADLSLTWNFVIFLLVIVAGVIAHESIHGVAWMLAGRKPWSSIKFGFQTATLTPYAHLKEPI